MEGYGYNDHQKRVKVLRHTSPFDFCGAVLGASSATRASLLFP